MLSMVAEEVVESEDMLIDVVVEWVDVGNRRTFNDSQDRVEVCDRLGVGAQQ